MKSIRKMAVSGTFAAVVALSAWHTAMAGNMPGKKCSSTGGCLLLCEAGTWRVNPINMYRCLSALPADSCESLRKQCGIAFYYNSVNACNYQDEENLLSSAAFSTYDGCNNP